MALTVPIFMKLTTSKRHDVANFFYRILPISVTILDKYVHKYIYTFKYSKTVAEPIFIKITIVR
jgi:hypothetical protein